MRIKAGSDAHKELFCRQFIDTHEVFDPATLPWPTLDEAALGRLRGVPFWDEVYHTEYDSHTKGWVSELGELDLYLDDR